MSRAPDLAGVGRAADRGSPSRLLRALGLAVGAGLLVAALLGGALGASRSIGTQQRTDAVTPIYSAGQDARLVWTRMPPGVINGEPVTLIGVSGDGSLLPPGLDVLPRADEAALSPSLLTDLGAGSSRYGRPVGTIGAAGLVTPTERVAYIGLASPPADAAPVQGFGTAGERRYATLYQPAASLLSMAPLLILGIAGLGALAVAASISTGSRARLDRQLVLSGARAGQRLLVTSAADLPALCAGSLLSGTALGALLIRDTSILGTRTIYAATDARHVAWAWPVSVLTATVIGLAVTTTRPYPLAQALPRAPRRDGSPHGLVSGALCSAALLLAARPLIGLTPQGGVVRPVTLLLLLAAVAWTLPYVVACLLAEIGRGAAPVALRRGWAGILLGARQATEHAGRTIGLGRPVSLGVGLALVAVLWGGVLGGMAATGLAAAELADGRVAEITPRGPVTPALTSVLTSRPSDEHLLVVSDQALTRPVVRAACPDLRAVGLACARSQQTLPSTAPGGPALRLILSASVEVQPVTSRADALRDEADDQATLFVISSGPAVDMTGLTRAVLQKAPGAAQVDRLGDQWVVASSTATSQARWLMVYSALALAGLFAALGLGASSTLIDQTTETRALASWSERLTPLVAVVIWRLLLPYGLTFLAAAGTSWWFGSIQHELDSRFVLPGVFVAAVAVGGLLLSSALSATGLLTLVRADESRTG